MSLRSFDHNARVAIPASVTDASMPVTVRQNSSGMLPEASERLRGTVPFC